MRRGTLSRILTVALVVVLALLLCATALADGYPYQTTTNARVNLRRSASSSSSVLVKVPKGDTVTVMGKSGSYYQVVYAGITGYILHGYLNAPAEIIAAPTPSPTPSTATGYPYLTTTRDSVNLRAGASKSSTLIKKIPSGATLTVKGIKGDFAQVEYNGLSGYAMSAYIYMKPIVTATPVPSPTETISPAQNAAGYEVLQIGSTGRAVKALESALKELGFFAGTPDETFDSATEIAVVAMQSKNSYPATGIVDANLQAYLYSGTPKNASGRATTVYTLAPVDGVTIRKGNTGDLVTEVQQQLKQLGYYTGSITGTYDNATLTAVKSFQKKNSLSADGACGAKTQEALFSADAVSSGATARPAATPQPTPSPVPTYQVPTAQVQRGSTGDNAKLVQQRLKELGYYTGRVDGKFGSGSVNALKAFQMKNGLESDGIAGSGTYALLFSYLAKPAVEVPTLAPVTATPKPTPSPTPAPQYPTNITKSNVTLIREGTTGTAVLLLQQRLTELGYYTASMDSVCRTVDVSAIRLFQQKNGLEADGVAGYETQKLLYSSSALKNTTTSGTTGISYVTLRMGSSGAAVTRLQNRLIALGYLANGSADGKYGAKTADAIISFQRASGLVRDGIAGQETQSLLYATAASTATPAPQATPSPTASLNTDVILRRGDSNVAVQAMQQRLVELGYLTGKADGIFGVQTYRALVAFQKANRLSADGVAGSLTLSALIQASSGSANQPSATQTPGSSTGITVPAAAQVIYANWYTTVRDIARVYQYATVYDYATGLSWQVHMFSFGNHAEAEPLTAADTAVMQQAFGGTTWTPKPVWVVFGNGQVYMATTHDTPHGVQHITDNNFAGHLCIHFPRTASQVAAIGSYATSHQTAMDKAWKETQDMIQ